MKKILCALLALAFVFALFGCAKDVQSIALGGDFTLEVGQQVNLKPTVTPENPADYTVSWSSSDESIVKIGANGEVLGNAPGQATVTARVSDSVYDSCVVTVVLPAGEPSVELNSFERLVFDALVENVKLQAQNDVEVTGYEIIQVIEYNEELGLLSLYINVESGESVIDSNVMVLALADYGEDYPFGSLWRDTISGRTVSPGELDIDALNTALDQVIGI